MEKLINHNQGGLIPGVQIWINIIQSINKRNILKEKVM